MRRDSKLITVEDVKHHTLDYKCTCGVEGECMFKPPDGNSLMLLVVKCPMCGESERIKVMKYDSEESRQQLTEEDAELSWVIVMDNRIKEE